MNIYIPDLTQAGQGQLTDNTLRLPYYVHLVPYSYYASGNKTISSGIKTTSYSEVFLPISIDNVTGFVFNNFSMHM